LAFFTFRFDDFFLAVFFLEAFLAFFFFFINPPASIEIRIAGNLKSPRKFIYYFLLG
jgi:hypothetical protein